MILDLLDHADRQCGGRDGTEICWLIEELPLYNSLLRPTRLELVEAEPGKLLLRTFPSGRCDCSLARVSGEPALSSVVEYLGREHECITFLQLRCALLEAAQSYDRRSGERSSPPGIRFYEALVHFRALEALSLTCSSVTDNVAHYVAEVINRSAPTLRRVVIERNFTSARGSDCILRSLSSCERLTSLTYGDDMNPAGIRIVAQEMTGSLRKLALLCLEEQAQVDTLASALSTSMTPLEEVSLSLSAKILDTTALFSGVATNGNLRRLCVQRTVARRQWFQVAAMEYSTPLVASVASVISRSRCLRGVTLRHVCVDCQGSVALAAALTANKSLVRLELKDCSFASVCPTQLYKAVHGDPTLRAAVLPGLYERFDTRITVPAFLCHVAGPGRLSLSLSAGDLVHAPLGCDLHLQLGHMDFSASEASGILAVIAGSHSLLHLGVELGHDRRKAELLLDAVRTNQSIKSFALLLTSWPRSDGVLADCVDSLVASTTLEEVALTMTALEVSSAESLARLVSNSRIKKLSVSVYSAVDDAVLEALARGMGESKFVVEFQFACGCWPPLSRSTHRLFDAVERNMGLLNRAAGFALGTATDVASATAFDALCDGPALFPHVERLSSQREHGAAQLLARAKCRIAGDFFVLAGVVRERIVCHPGPATQFDSLNSDCLAAIARWLKLDDVRRG